MQLRKLRRKMSRNQLVDIGTPLNSQLVPRWQVGKSQEEIAQTIRSRQMNPQDPINRPADITF